jgi:hypothetical protein
MTSKLLPPRIILPISRPEKRVATANAGSVSPVIVTVIGPVVEAELMPRKR